MLVNMSGSKQLKANSGTLQYCTMYTVHCVQYHQTRDSYLVTMQVLSNYKASYDTVNIKLTVQGSYTIQISIIKLRLFLDIL